MIRKKRRTGWKRLTAMFLAAFLLMSFLGTACPGEACAMETEEKEPFGTAPVQESQDRAGEQEETKAQEETGKPKGKRAEEQTETQKNEGDQTSAIQRSRDSVKVIEEAQGAEGNTELREITETEKATEPEATLKREGVKAEEESMAEGEPETASSPSIRVTGIGEHIRYSLDGEEGRYLTGSQVRALLSPEEGYAILEAGIQVRDTEGTALNFELLSQAQGDLEVSFTAGERDVEILAQVKEKRRVRLNCQDRNGAASASLSGQVSPKILYEGMEVFIQVRNTGTVLWAAQVSAGEEDVEFTMTEDGLSFVMPDSDVEVLIYELESVNQGELSGEDSAITGDWQGSTSSTKKDGEPDVELRKSARWTDIEDGYAELTITEQDTSDYSNIPTDYIFILDRTRTMSLNEATMEGGSGAATYINQNSPCINPEHYYYKGGISLRLLDYFTGYAEDTNTWYSGLNPGAGFWNRHYNAAGQNILPAYENGCQDRLSLAKTAILELVDQVEQSNRAVPPGALRSRIAFWSFGASFRSLTGDKRDQGLYNYTPLTEDYNAVRRAVNEVKTYSGTYYLASLTEAYEILTSRNMGDATRRNNYTKVVFLSDGQCEDQVAESRAMAEKIKALPNTELFTLAIGMTADSEGARLLRELASSDRHTASFWQNLTFDGGQGSVLAQTLFAIDKKEAEVKACNKILTDQIETRYWEPVEVLAATGGLQQVNLDKSTGRLTWRIPEGAGTVYTCTVRLKLKDAYRYLLSDTSYPTNRDAKGATAAIVAADPAQAGAVVDYTISGGMYHTQSRRAGVVTPTLKYGTVEITGRKNWTVADSQAERVTVRLMRTLPGQTGESQVNNDITNVTRGWQYAFNRRVLPGGGEKPLIKYDEKGRSISYQVQEAPLPYYIPLAEKATVGTADSNGGAVTDIQLYNEPFKVQAQIQKVDEETGNPLSGAEFSVYVWSSKQKDYVPYRGTTQKNTLPYETGTVNGAAEGMQLREAEKGIYRTPAWLYYAPDNQGRFRIVETRAPQGYYGDWENEEAGKTGDSKEEERAGKTGDSKEEERAGKTGVSGEAEDPGRRKKVYDFQISKEKGENSSTVFLSNQRDGAFGNKRVKGRLHFTKNDLEAGTAAAQGDAVLEGAVYRLYAAADLTHGDGTTGVLYQKDQEIPVRFTGQRDGARSYTFDPAGTDVLTTGEGAGIEVENLELGSYYLKEETASQGYLTDPKKHAITFSYEGEESPVVEAEETGDERVKKQALSFYKLTGAGNSDQVLPLKGAGFSVYLLSSLRQGRYMELTDSEAAQAILDDFRNPQTLGYEAFREICPALVYAAEDDPDVERGRLVKSVDFGSGKVFRAEETGGKHAYLAAEMKSDEKGIVTTPSLPYGRYAVVETTPPEGVLATRPFVFTVVGDDADGTVNGDGQGKRLEELVLRMDRPVMALVRIVKQDACSRKPVMQEGASYVIHDVEDAWFSYYTKEMTTEQKQKYKERYGDLVVQYSQGVWMGTREHPYTTRQMEKEDEANVYIETPAELPGGIYELEELLAPENYILQGKEGVIAKAEGETSAENGTFYEREEEGAWKAAPSERTRFVVSSGEAVYEEEVHGFVVTAKQANTPAIGKISVYAQGEQLVSAEQEGKGGLSGLLKRVKGFLVEDLGGTGVLGTGLFRRSSSGKEPEAFEDYTFLYELRPIKGAQFEIRAAEDIYSPEGGGNKERLFAKGELVETLTTDQEGKSWTGQEDWPDTEIAKGLPLGRYTVTQTLAGRGFALTEENAVPRQVEIAYAGQEVPVIYRDEAYTSPRQQVQISVGKQDEQTGESLAGAVFGLYTAEDIQGDQGQILVKADTLIAAAKTWIDQEGQVQEARFQPKLPLGEYYVEELKAPAGYARGDSRLFLDASYREDQSEYIRLSGVIQNQPIRVQIDLMDYFTGVELEGASLEVTDEEGNMVARFVTTQGGNPMIPGLEFEKEYRIRTVTARDGYSCQLYCKEGYETRREDAVELKKSPIGEAGEEVAFRVQNDGRLQVVSLFSKPATGELTLEKTGEVPTGTREGRDDRGAVKKEPVYELRGLPGAEYVLLAKEEIAYPDGSTGTVFGQNELVLDQYAAGKGTGALKHYELRVPEGSGELADVSACIGITPREGASLEELREFYREHKTEVQRELPDGRAVGYVLRTGREGTVRITGLPLGNFEAVEVKAPVGYYRDLADCTREVSLQQTRDGDSGSAPVKKKIIFENDRQQLTDAEDPLPPVKEAVYHPAIRITKQAEKSVYRPGERAVYHITVCNTGDVDLKEIFVTDSLAGSLLRAADSREGNAVYSADAKEGGVIHRIDFLAVGEQETFTYEYLVRSDALAGSRIDNQVYTKGIPVIPDPGSDSYGRKIPVDPASYEEPEDRDTEKIFVENGSILVKKETSKRMYAPGETAVYQITVMNTGEMPLEDVTIRDSLEGTFRLEPEDGLYLRQDGSAGIRELPAHGQVVLSYVYEIPQDAKAGSLKNVVWAKGTVKGETEEPVEAWDEEVILVQNPQIAITKAADKQSYEPGETAVYTMIVTNTGDCELTDVTVTEQLLEGGAFTESEKGSFAGTKAWIGELAVGECVRLTFACQVPQDGSLGETIPNRVTVRGVSKPVLDPTNPETPEGEPNYLPIVPVWDRDTEEISVIRPRYGMRVRKYSVDEGTRKPQAGAAFTLYAGEDVKNLLGGLVYRAGEEIETAVSGADGMAVFQTDLPIGSYRVRETQAPDGHYSSKKELVFWLDQDQYQDDVHYLGVEDEVENAVTAVHIKLVDDRTGQELTGASLQITDKEGKPVRAWVTKASDGYTVKGLSVDTEYTVREVLPREGYLLRFTEASMVSSNAELTGPRNAEVSFRLWDVASDVTEAGKLDKTSLPEETKILLETPFVTGRVRLNKDGEILEGWTPGDRMKAFVKSLFRYHKKPLEDVEFTVYAGEDIVHPDGVTGVMFRKGEIVASGVRGIQETAVGRTDRLGTLCFAGMYLGQYEIRETSLVEGFVRDTKPRAFSLRYVDGYTDPVEAEGGTIHWTNQRQQVEIEVEKLDLESKEYLSGAVFGLYNEEVIQNEAGAVLVPADTLLETVETDAGGKAMLTGSLPQAAYYVKELQGPVGYDLAQGNRVPVDGTYDQEKEEIRETARFENIPVDIKPEVEKRAPQNAAAGEVFSYTVNKVRNAGNGRAEAFTLTDQLPEEVRLLHLDTGTFQGFEGEAVYSIWYQTDKSPEYRLWRDQILGDQNLRLDTADLKLGEGERICSFQYRFGTVEKGFAEQETPVYAVQVREEITGGTMLVNRIRLQGSKLGITYEDLDERQTRVDVPKEPAGNPGGEGSSPLGTPDVQTGDETRGGKYLLLALGTILLGVYGLRKRERR